jgi:hypothetical protein
MHGATKVVTVGLRQCRFARLAGADNGDDREFLQQTANFDSMTLALDHEVTPP